MFYTLHVKDKIPIKLKAKSTVVCSSCYWQNTYKIQNKTYCCIQFMLMTKCLECYKAAERISKSVTFLKPTLLWIYIYVIECMYVCVRTCENVYSLCVVMPS